MRWGEDAGTGYGGGVGGGVSSSFSPPTILLTDAGDVVMLGGDCDAVQVDGDVR